MQSSVSHGISVGVERVHSEFILHLKAAGLLGHADYEIISPVIDCALQCMAHPGVKVFFDATDFEGWQPGSAWEDLSLGLVPRNQFSRIAILGRCNWHKVTSCIATWFMSGEARYFETRQQAMEWLTEPTGAEQESAVAGSAWNQGRLSGSPL